MEVEEVGFGGLAVGFAPAGSGFGSARLDLGAPIEDQREEGERQWRGDDRCDEPGAQCGSTTPVAQVGDRDDQEHR